MQNNSKIIFIVFLFIIVFSFVGVEKMTEANCDALNGNAKKTCLKNHIGNVLDPDDKYYMYVNGKPKFGAGAVSGVNGKNAHFQAMINAFNAASNEGAKYCAGMIDNQLKIDCLAEKKTQTATAATAVKSAWSKAVTKAAGAGAGAGAGAASLIFSAYGEGSSYNKFLEIYNPTGADVDLSDYALANVANAPTTAGQREYLNDIFGTCSDTSEFKKSTCEAASMTWTAHTIPSKGTYTICHPRASDGMKNGVTGVTTGGECNVTHPYLSNGDDGYCLVKDATPGTPGTPGTKIDCIGDFNGDPGSGWQVCDETNATYNRSLRRKCSVIKGNMGEWNSTTSIDNCEWEVLDNETWNKTYAAEACPTQTR